MIHPDLLQSVVQQRMQERLQEAGHHLVFCVKENDNQTSKERRRIKEQKEASNQSPSSSLF
jgi:hypothetical protein